MVQTEEMFMIKDMRSKGMYIKDIAKLTGRDPKTIRKYIDLKETDRGDGSCGRITSNYMLIYSWR